MFPQYCKAAIYKHAKKPINVEPVFDKRKTNKGRPTKLSVQNKRSIVRSVSSLRIKVGSFASKRIQLESGVSHVSNRAIRNHLNKKGYHYLQSRKKGLLNAGDLKARVKFCQKVRRNRLMKEFWRTAMADPDRVTRFLELGQNFQI